MPVQLSSVLNSQRAKTAQTYPHCCYNDAQNQISQQGSEAISTKTRYSAHILIPLDHSALARPDQLNLRITPRTQPQYK